MFWKWKKVILGKLRMYVVTQGPISSSLIGETKKNLIIKN
jgi:hypothetical protein